MQDGGAGTWIVETDGKKTTVEADRWDYDSDNNLQMWSGGSIVATFRWWTSVTRKAD